MAKGILLDSLTGRPVGGLSPLDPPLRGETIDGWMSRNEGRQARDRSRLLESAMSNLHRSGELGDLSPRMSGMNRFWEPLQVDTADGTQVLNTTTRTIICPDYTFQANDVHIFVGACIHQIAYFDVSFVITTPGTMTLDVRWNGSAGTVLATSGAYAPDPTAAQTTRSGWFETMTVWRTIGTAGTAFTMGRMGISDVDDASATSLQGNINMFVVPTNAPAVVSALDTTVSRAFSTCVTFSVATATTQLTNHLRILSSL